MRDYSTYISFKPDFPLPTTKKDTDLWFIFNNNLLMIIPTKDGIRIPTYKDIKKLYPTLTKKFYLGDFETQSCFCSNLECIGNCFDGSFMSLKEVASFVSTEFFSICGRASQLLYWDSTTNFCGKCGGIISNKDWEFSKYCSKCNISFYPKISPAIIVAITKGQEILLAHNSNFPNNLYSIIAGFVDPSESLEDCIKREVFEEVGIKVKNITYFGSQPWPYPDSLMIGFFAEYDGGEIKVDGKEILHAAWFNKNNLPILPQKTSIARKIINKFLEDKY